LQLQQHLISHNNSYHPLPHTLDIAHTQLLALKDKMAVVLRKTKNDDQLITALRAELAAAVRAGGGAGRHIRGSVTGVEDR